MAWIEVSKDKPCHICGKPDWCSITEDGGSTVCRRNSGGEERIDKSGGVYWYYRPKDIPYKPNYDNIPESKESKRADDNTLDRIYSSFLSKLCLSSKHKDDLITRGLSEELITKNVYRTLPLQGRAEITKELVDEFGDDVFDTPGFYIKEEKGNKWPTFAGSPGLLIPVRDTEGKVLGLKIRLDEVIDEKKYTWLSSRKRDDGRNGTGQINLIHFTNNVNWDKIEGLVRITEGPLKADIATCLDNIPTIAIPGVSNYQSGVYALHKLGVNEGIVAIDMDYEDNEQVARSLLGLLLSLQKEGIVTSMQHWPKEQGKGIDDFLLTVGKPELLKGNDLQQIIEKLKRDYPSIDNSKDNNEFSEEEWGEMKDLPSLIPEVPSMPENIIPNPLKEWAVDIAERACVPLEMVVAPIPVAAGTIIGRKVAIRPSQYDDFTIVPNLWGGVVARPGLMKTSIINESMSPIHQLAEKRRKEYEIKRSEADAEETRIIAHIEAVKADMKKEAKNDNSITKINSLKEKLIELNKDLEQNKITEQRYLTQDATVEKIGELLRDNPNGILILRDELAGWLRNMDKQGREGDREFYLEGWNGTGSYTVDRIGRGTIHVPSMTLSVFGGIQPGKLRKYIKGAIEGDAGADGLLQRIQILVWPDKLPNWKRIDRSPNLKAKDRGINVFSELDSLQPDKLGAEKINDNENSFPFLRFSSEAQEFHNNWRDKLENRLRSKELEAMPAFESHLSKYRSLMPTLALIFHLIDVGDTSVSSVSSSPRCLQEKKEGVSLKAAQLAVKWCDYLEQHARKVYATEIYTKETAANHLSDKIREGDVFDGMTIRDIYRKGWTGLSTKEIVLDAISILKELGWVRTETNQTGGAPTSVIRLHPELINKAQ